MRKTHTSQNQARVARILFAGFFGLLPNSINKILLDAQISEYNKKISITTNTYDTLRDNRNTTPIAPQLQNFHIFHPFFLVSRNYRKTAKKDHMSPSHSYPQSPISHIVVHQLNIGDTYEQIVEQPHTTNFCSQNNQFFSQS